jgi:hypothetical protein
MKYLKYHKEYKLENLQKDFGSSEMIREVFENDITWGGSLLGRLINSTIRAFKIGFNYTKISSIVKSIETELYELYSQVAPKGDIERINDIKIRMVLTEIYNVVTSDDDVETKIKKLIGSQPLVDNTMTLVEKSDIENKSELLDKLKKFKEELLRLQKDANIDVDEEGEDEKGEKKNDTGDQSDKNPAFVFYSNSKSLLSAIAKIHYDIKNNTVKFQQGSSGTGEKVSTLFDEKKYQLQRANTIQEIQKKIEMAKNAVNIYTSKKNTLTKDKDGKITQRDPGYQERINFYTNEIKKLENKKSQLSKTSTTTTKPKEEFDKDADKRAKELRDKMDDELDPIGTNESFDFLLEEIDANLRDQEVDAKRAWNKVVNAYNNSGISKYISYIESLINSTGVENIKNSKKKIIEIGRQVVINHSNVGKPISLDELIKEAEGPSVSDVAKSISLMSRILFAFSEDLGLLGSYGASYKSNNEAAGGAGNHIKLFVISLKKMLEVYPSIQKESIVMNYSSFILIKEDNKEDDRTSPVFVRTTTDDKEENETEEIETDKNNQSELDTNETGDKVRKAWFKFFKKDEQNKWKITKEDDKFRDKFEEEDNEVKIEVGEGVAIPDPIIKIVNLFGKAYDLYATDYIPSGRPGGRVSQRTLREYENIGKGNDNIRAEGDYYAPGKGPWAAKLPYNKFQDGITKLLEDARLRKVLAIKFVSQAEKQTGTPMKEEKSGKTLMNFMNDMLDNDEGTFKKHRKAIFKAYFNSDYKDPNGERTSGSGNKTPDIPESEKGETNKPFFSNKIVEKPILTDKIKNFIKVVTKDKKVFLLYPIDVTSTERNVSFFKYQVSEENNPKQSIATKYLENQKSPENEKLDLTLLENEEQSGIPYKSDCEVAIGFAKITDNPFGEGKNFNMKFMRASDVKNKDYTKIEDYTLQIKDIYYLVIPENDKKGNQKIKRLKVQDDNIKDKDVNLQGEIPSMVREFMKSYKK